MVKTVAREYHWAPNIIGAFFIDDNDWHGLEFWYNDVNEMNKELKTPTPKKTE